MLGIVLGTGDSKLNKTDIIVALMELSTQY